MATNQQLDSIATFDIAAICISPLTSLIGELFDSHILLVVPLYYASNTI